MSRRGFLYASGGAGSALLLGTRTGSPGRSLAAPQRDMVLQVARTVAVFPVTFPFLSPPGAASRARVAQAAAASRATAARLSAAAAGLPPARLALARAGADQLIAAGLRQQGRAGLVEALAEQAGSAAARPGAGSVVALAIATLSERLRPSADLLAQAWLDGLRGLRQRGTLAQAAAHLGAL